MAVHKKNTNIKVKEKERESVEGEYRREGIGKKGKSIKNALYFPGVVRTKAFQAFP